MRHGSQLSNALLASLSASKLIAEYFDGMDGHLIVVERYRSLRLKIRFAFIRRTRSDFTEARYHGTLPGRLDRW
jgi:hypothetical protein